MKIVIASGKGGTGKTTVATNLAFSLKESKKVQLLDCDVEEPNCHLFLDIGISDTKPVKVKIPQVQMDICTLCSRCSETCVFNAIVVVGKEVLVFPPLCHSCGGCAYFCPTGAITEVDKEIGVVKKGKAGQIDVAYGELNIGEAIAIPLGPTVYSKLNS
jgi:MinD superfamily P-loop ATPase